MRVGVTGSSGLIGSSLVQSLTTTGHEVIAFVRPGSKPAHAPTITWDPSRNELDQADLERVGPLDAVVNLAGAGIGDQRWSVARKAEILASRVTATALLVRSLSLLSTKPFLLNASAIGFYGSRDDESLDETSVLGQGFLARVCEAWENEAARYAQNGGRVAIARTGIVLDQRGGALKKQVPLFRYGLGGRLGTGHQWLSPISLHDEVRALAWLLDRRLEGPFNLTGPTPVTNRTFTETLAHALHRPAFLAVPGPALAIVLGREGAKELVLSSQKVFPKSLLNSGFIFDDPTISMQLTRALLTSQ